MTHNMLLRKENPSRGTLQQIKMHFHLDSPNNVRHQVKDIKNASYVSASFPKNSEM